MYRNHWIHHQQVVQFCFLFCFYQIDRGRWTQVFFYVFDGCGNIGIIIGLISIPEIQKCHWDRPACSIARFESTVRQDSHVSVSLDSSSSGCALFFCFYQIEVSELKFFLCVGWLWEHRNNNRTHQYSRNSKMPLRPACMFHRTSREYSEAGLLAAMTPPGWN